MARAQVPVHCKGVHMDLDVLNPDHVGNHALIDADLGVGGRRVVSYGPGIPAPYLPGYDVSEQPQRRSARW